MENSLLLLLERNFCFYIIFQFSFFGPQHLISQFGYDKVGILNKGFMTIAINKFPVIIIISRTHKYCSLFSPQLIKKNTFDQCAVFFSFNQL